MTEPPLVISFVIAFLCDGSVDTYCFGGPDLRVLEIEIHRQVWRIGSSARSSSPTCFVKTSQVPRSPSCVNSVSPSLHAPPSFQLLLAARGADFDPRVHPKVAVLARCREDDFVVFRLEAFLQGPRYLGFVFDHQDPHGELTTRDYAETTTPTLGSP